MVFSYRPGLMSGAAYAPADEGGGSPHRDPNTDRELARARDDAKTFREERDVERAEKERLGKEIGALKASVTQMQADHATALAQKDAAVVAAQAEFDKQLGDAKTAGNARLVEAEVKAAASAAGIHDAKAVKLLDLAKVKIADDGTVTGATEIVEAARREMAWAFKVQGTGNSQPPPKAAEQSAGTVKKFSEMTVDEQKAWQRSQSIRA